MTLYDEVLEVVEVRASVLGGGQAKLVLRRRDGTGQLLESGPSFETWVSTAAAPRVGTRVRVTLETVKDDR